MPVQWVIAHHPDLGDAVLPAAAIASYPGWEAVGEPSLDQDALSAALERAAAEAAAAQQSAPPKQRAATPASAPAVAPAGAAPKE